MILVILTALTVVCGAARIDQSNLSPISTSTSGTLLALPHKSTHDLSTGSYKKEVQANVMGAVNPRTRRSRQEPSGPKGPRTGWPTFTQFRSTETHFGDKPLTTQGNVVASKANTQTQTSCGQKQVSSSLTTTPLGSYQQTQSESAGFLFDQNSQSTLSAGSVSTTDILPDITLVYDTESGHGISGGFATTALLRKFSPARSGMQ